MAAKLFVLSPTPESAIVHVTKVVPEERGDRLLHTIYGDRLAVPPVQLVVTTLSDWRASLCRESIRVKKPVAIEYVNRGHGDRRLVEVDWA